MDSRLGQRLLKIEEQIDLLSKAESLFLDLDAHKDVLYSELFRKSQGKSIADREAFVYSTDDWKSFAKGLSQAHAEYNKQKRWYELRLKAYDAEHLSYKIEGSVIPRSGAS